MLTWLLLIQCWVYQDFARILSRGKALYLCTVVPIKSAQAEFS